MIFKKMMNVEPFLGKDTGMKSHDISCVIVILGEVSQKTPVWTTYIFLSLSERIPSLLLGQGYIYKPVVELPCPPRNVCNNPSRRQESINSAILQAHFQNLVPNGNFPK